MYSTSATASRRARPSSSRTTAEEVPIFLNSTTIASLEHGHIDMMADSSANTQLSSDDDVHISLGIQQGLERAWSTALSRVGAISLAWQNETELAPHTKTAKEIDPALVFDGMHAASNSQGSKNYTPVVSVHGTDQADGDQEPWSSNQDDVRNILETTPQTQSSHAWTAKHRKPTSISTLPKAANVARRTTDYSADQKHSHHLHSQRLSPLAATRIDSSVARADENTKRPHRMSIRLERLLPHPKTPESASIAKAILISPRLYRNRKILNRLRPCETKDPSSTAAKGIVESAVLHRRTSSLPNLPKSDFGQSDLANTNEGIANKTSRSSVHQRDGSLSSLEGQVSNMFAELGICSPYIDASRQAIADQRSNPSNSPYRPDPNMWFYQPEYTKDAAELMGSRQERPNIMLIDDDSSCAENSADYTTLKHQSFSYKGTRMGSSTIISTRPLIRRRDTTSTNSTALENAAPTTLDYPYSKAESAVHTCTNCQQVDPGMNAIDHICLSQPTVPSDGVCTACRDERKTCCQMQLVLRRIEQADQYAQNASRRASDANTLLADLRAQSRLLSDTLLLSQKRASVLNNTLAGAIDAALGMKVTGIDQSLEPNSLRMDGHSRIRVNEHYNHLSKKMLTLKKRTNSLDARAKAIRVLRRDNGLDAICAAKTHVHSWLDGNVTANTRITDPDLESEVDLEKEVRKSKPDGLNYIHDVSGLTNMTVSTDLTKRMRRRRRPVQPISIRIQRISNQWDELQSSISELGISGFEQCKPLDGADKETPADNDADIQSFQLASKVTADGLKLIQQILKTTHDALNGIRSPPNTPNT